MVRTDKKYSVGQIPWLYPHVDAPPRGVKLNILTKGGIAIHGEWRNDCGFIAWQHLFKRDKQLEEEMMIMELGEGADSIRKFRVPLELPCNIGKWTRILNARWLNDDGFDIAAIYKMADEDGYVTPITFQFDRRNPKLFETGYSILNTGKVFPTWVDLCAYWPQYIETLAAQGSEVVLQLTEKE